MASVMLSGDQGYVGSVLLPKLNRLTWRYDAGFYAERPARQDLRSLSSIGPLDAIIHLASLSNDPLGALDETATWNINYHATMKLATMAKEAGTKRFIFASSQSIYGLNDSDVPLTEDAPKNPLTAYARSKWLAEQALMELADDGFCVVALRPATVFGWSPAPRTDIVFNNLLAQAYTTGRIEVRGDGSEWRPAVHIRDLCDAFLACLEAPAETINGKAYNVGRLTSYMVAEMAWAAQRLVPNAEISFGEAASDRRSYRTSGERIYRDLGVSCKRDLLSGGLEMLEQFERVGFTAEDMGRKTNRLAQLQWLRETGKLDKDLRWT